jgi:hypothetical protein
VLGVRTVLGGFAPEDFEHSDAPDKPRQAVPVLVSYRLWLKSMGGDPAAVGRLVVISDRLGVSYAIRVAGVLSPEFVFPIDPGDEQPDLLTPVPRVLRAV